MKVTASNFRRVIEARLSEMECSAGAAEKAAGLTPDTIRNVLRSKKNLGPRLDSAEDICGALGLEFYIGPPRDDPKAQPGFADAAATFFRDQAENADFPLIEALDEAGDLAVNVDFALSQSFLSAHSLRADQLVVVRVPDGQGDRTISAGALVILRRDAGFAPDGSYCGYFRTSMSGIEISRLTAPDDTSLIRYADTDKPPELLRRTPHFKMVGPVLMVFTEIEQKCILERSK